MPGLLSGLLLTAMCAVPFGAGLLSCERLGCGEVKTDGGPDAGAAAPVTKLTDLKGTIEWRSGPGGEWKPVQEGQAVAIGDGLRAGPGGKFTIVFADGRQIRIEGQGQMKLAKEVDDEFALLMEQGEVDVVANQVEGKQYRLIFSDTSDMVLLREGRASLKVKPGSAQVEMIMGSATINQGGETKPLQAGQSFALDIGAGEITGRQELITTLLDPRRQSRIRPPGQKGFRRPSRRKLELEPGTAVITQRRGSVELADDSGSRVVLSAKSSAVFEGAFRSQEGRESILKLDSGEATVHLHRGAKGGATQKLVMPLGVIVASAQGSSAEVNVRSRGKSTRVTVYTGTAEVAVGDKTVTVGPGQTLEIGKSDEVGQPERMKLPKIRAKEGVRTRVFYDRRISQVGLIFKSGGQEQAVLEISSLPDFEKLSLREPVAGGSFIFNNVRPGKHYWRVARPDAGPGPVGRLEIASDPIAKQLSSGKLTNMVPDTGIKTTIYFQGKVPVLNFRWDAVEGAASYRVRIYTEDDLEKPVIEETAKKTRLALAAGKLKEGTYFWYQSAWDAGGTEIETSQMNKLSLVFDNATPLLRLESPRPGEKPQGGQVEVRGLAPPGSSVQVGKQQIQVSADGRFNQTLSGVERRAVLIFKLIKKGAGDVFYLRHLR